MGKIPERNGIHDSIILDIRKTFPDCPPEFAFRFISMLECGADEIAAQATLVLAKPYGRNNILVDSGEFGLSFAQFNPGCGTSLHFHSSRREFFCVHHGELTLVADGRESRLSRYGCGNSRPPLQHSLANRGNAPLGVLEIFSPALLNDKTRVADRYQRPLGAVRFDQ